MSELLRLLNGPPNPAAIAFAVDRTRRDTPHHYWRVGLTDDLYRRRTEHGNPAAWYSWFVGDEKVASDLERFFIARGMDGHWGGRSKGTYLYILPSPKMPPLLQALMAGF